MESIKVNQRLSAIWAEVSRCGRNNEYTTEYDRNQFDEKCISEGAEYYARRFTAYRTMLLSGLQTGVLEEPAEYPFEKREVSALPTFLYKAWRAVFNDNGELLPNISVDAVSCLNQLFAVFGKIRGGHTPESVQRCVDRFVSNETSLKQRDEQYAADPSRLEGKFAIDPRPPGRFARAGAIVETASILVRYVLSRSDPREILPKHGSGSSACGTLVYQRYQEPRFVKKIDEFWPYADYYYAGYSHLCDSLPPVVEGGTTVLDGWTVSKAIKPCQGLNHLETYEPCAKILVVDKDARGPRIISCEPRETMFPQQGVNREITQTLEAHPLTSGLVNFTDQVVNQQQAFLGSITRDTSTLDLKDASDLLSMSLVEMLFPSNWVAALKACRSEQTKLPDGTLVTLSKHAPMGSACCFPVMALSIWALLTAYTNYDAIRRGGHLRKRKLPVRVYVYGDDIIIPTSFAEGGMGLLEAVGLAVNRDKSFVSGHFRESCGKEYYRGVDVTPCRLRALPNDDYDSRMKVIAFHNNLYVKYGFQPFGVTALVHEWYKNVPERSVRIARPHATDLIGLGTEGAPIWGMEDIVNDASFACVLNVFRADNSTLPSRRVRHLCCTQYRFLAVVPCQHKYDTDCWSQTFRALVNPRLETPLGVDSLAKRVRYKYRWAQLH